MSFNIEKRTSLVRRRRTVRGARLVGRPRASYIDGAKDRLNSPITHREWGCFAKMPRPRPGGARGSSGSFAGADGCADPPGWPKWAMQAMRNSPTSGRLRMDSTVKTLPIRPPQADNDSSALRRPSREEAEAAVRTLIRWAGDDPTREGLVETPRRVVKAYEQLFEGYNKDPAHALERVFEEIG